MIKGSGNKTVDRMYGFNTAGTFIPDAWFHVFLTKNGKPDFPLITVLSEIVYWYRPAVITDSKDSGSVMLRKKFKADLLQKSYNDIAERYNLSKRQVKEAMDRLEDAGIIRRELRQIVAGGTVHNNVLYIDLDADNLIAITNSDHTEDQQSSGAPPTSQRTRVLRCGVPDPASQCGTYTEITTESDTKDYPIDPIRSSSSYTEELNRLMDQVGYDDLISDLPSKKEAISGVLELIADELTSSTPVRVNSHEVARIEFETRMHELTGDHIRYVLERMDENCTDVRNIRAYLLTALYNAPATIDSYYTAKVNHDMASGRI